jgi:hypothetical protein
MKSDILPLQDVFTLSGVPNHTFVQPVEYPRLLVALQTNGRSIVIEGPSGIGKTTAVMKAVSAAGFDKTIVSLSARKSGDVALIRELSGQLPLGTILIDDFHRLPDDVKRDIADLMKTLADESASHSKLIVLGITSAGQSLLVFGKDLANRIEVIPFEANPQHKVKELLDLGERALNVTINIAEEIVAAAQGSFYIAQMLAYHTCLQSDLLYSSHNRITTAVSYETIKSLVMGTLKRSFHDTAVAFARGTKLRREGRAPYLHLLYWASQSKSWSISINREIDRHPEQRGSVSQVVTKGFLQELIQSSAEIQNVIYFDHAQATLVVQDPQFVFYIRNLSWPRFAEEVGYVSIEFPSRYDFALSFAGPDRDIADALFEALSERELEVFYDKNEQHRILAEDVEDYLRPIYESDAALIICVLGSEYPTRVWTRFESDHFKKRLEKGEVIPVVLAGTQLGVFDEAGKVGHFPWDRNKDFNKQLSELTGLLVKKSVDVRKRRIKNTKEGASNDI